MRCVQPDNDCVFDCGYEVRRSGSLGSWLLGLDCESNRRLRETYWETGNIPVVYGGLRAYYGPIFNTNLPDPSAPEFIHSIPRRVIKDL